MKLKRILIFVFAISLFVPNLVFAQSTNKVPTLKTQEYKLKNGLRVIMHEDHSTPIAAVNVWYHVGSKNEAAGRTGFAHLFEHMMFQGSKNYNDNYMKPLEDVGANFNGSTNSDRTNYYQAVPSNFLEMALFMEADRMGGLLEAMTQEKLDNQRDVVKNERRQRYDNAPYGTAVEKIYATMYPKEHPYNWTTIGSLDDLTAASQDDVKAFFRQYYVPNNASLVIAGDFNPKQARLWVEKYFGSIKKGANIERPSPAQPKLSGETRKVYEDAVQLPRVYMAWQTVPQGHKDEPALDVLSRILSGGRGSRLQSNLIYGKQTTAQDISAFHPTREIAGEFMIVSTARPAKTLEEIEAEINSEIERLKKEPPTAEEVTRGRNFYASQTVYGLQTVLDKADLLNNNATFYGKPDLFQQQLYEYRKVTPADVQRVANAYLNANRLVVSFVPRKEKTNSPQNAGANTPTSKSQTKEQQRDYSKNLPSAGADPKFVSPAIEKQKLSNGLEVWLVRQKELPIISMNMVFKTGGTIDPDGKSGLAWTTSSFLTNGTKTRSAVEITNQLQDIGASVNAGAGWDSASVSMQTLTENLDKALDVYADVIVNAAFSESELEINRRRALAGFLQRKDDPGAIAGVVYNKLLYGATHPYGNQLSGSEESIKSLKQSDLVNFHQTYYRPNNGVLIVVGDTEIDSIKPKLETAFSNWKPAEVSQASTPSVSAFDKPGIYVVDKPGAVQSVINIGQIGVSRDNPDYYALQVMNSILGGGTTSRIYMNLRQDKGYTYGAYSGFQFRRGDGPFTARASVQTAVTKESVIEFMKELNSIRGAIPVTQEELNKNKKSLIRGLLNYFETNEQIAAQLSTQAVYDLPDSYYTDYIARINAVTLADVNRVANKYLSPDKMAILVVGDKAAIEPKLREIEVLGKMIHLVDTEGKPIK